jgi:hypothetical protein
MESLAIRVLGIPEIRLGEQPSVFSHTQGVGAVGLSGRGTGVAQPRIVDGLCCGRKARKVVQRPHCGQRFLACARR